MPGAIGIAALNGGVQTPPENETSDSASVQRHPPGLEAEFRSIPRQLLRASPGLDGSQGITCLVPPFCKFDSDAQNFRNVVPPALRI